MADYGDILTRHAPDDPALFRQVVDAPAGDAAHDQTTLPGKIAQLARAFDGRPLVWLYHAALIVCLRRGIDSGTAAARFQALWNHHGDRMIRDLDSRWLVSACDTLADHHPDPMTRSAALAVSSVMTTLRLGETERLARGAFHQPLGRPRGDLNLHDGLRWFEIGAGDTMANLSARLRRIEADGTLPGRILAELLRRAQAADTVFRRFADAHDLPATAWAPKSPPRIRVTLFNDTGAVGHYGCTAVSKAIDSLFGDAGIAIGWRHHVTSDALTDPGTRPAIDAADAVVVNGEGSIHSSSRRARSLAALGPLAHAAGKPAWLINATLQGNDDALVTDLRAFRHIWVREGASAAWARERGLPVTLAPDLSLCQHFEYLPRRGGAQGTVVLDSVLQADNPALHRIARATGGPLWSMKHDAEGRMQVLRGIPSGAGARPGFEAVPRGPVRDLAAFMAFLARHERMVTGRFHAVTLACLLRLPFHAFASNTWKIEAFLADAGLNPARLLPPGSGPPGPLPFTPDERAGIDRIIRRARIEAGEMVLRILSGQ
ncbi:MAG: polysaccharide pyruvyl transferase family protein [Paracoccaceae bacterium]|nr:MAG: polysaccharide pyruvyl transferase family protein [Paracoccaceae bacterium]